VGVDEADEENVLIAEPLGKAPTSSILCYIHVIYSHPCKNRKGGAPIGPEWDGEIKCLGHPPKNAKDGTPDVLNVEWRSKARKGRPPTHPPRSSSPLQSKALPVLPKEQTVGSPISSQLPVPDFPRPRFP
jgi:hypothetical protein